MVVCKFFQQGNCRYGQNCRFDHIYGSKYSYHAPVSQPQPSNASQGGVTDDQLVNQVLLDVQAVLKGGQWILSCYSPFKEKPNFPGITDLSPEEARLFIYEAKANNTLDQAVGYMNNLIKESTYKYEQLLQATPTVLKVLRSLYKNETVASPFSNTQGGFGGGSTASSVFRSAVQCTSVFGQSSPSSTPSIFGQSPTNANPSVFGQPTINNPSVFNQSPGFGQNTNQTPSVFGQTSPENAKSIFAQASQNVFGPSQTTNVFAPSPDAAKSMFAQATQNAFSTAQPPNPASVFGEASQSVFSKPTDSFNQQNDPFGQQKGPFGLQNDPFGQQKGPFGQSKDPFGQNNDPFNQQNNPFAPASAQNAFQTSEKQPNIYSDVNELSPEHIEAFKANDFKLGFIPEMPPPYSLCF